MCAKLDAMRCRELTDRARTTSNRRWLETLFDHCARSEAAPRQVRERRDRSVDAPGRRVQKLLGHLLGVQGQALELLLSLACEPGGIEAWRRRIRRLLIVVVRRVHATEDDRPQVVEEGGEAGTVAPPQPSRSNARHVERQAPREPEGAP